MQVGVVIIALGHKLYGSFAFNMAVSLKASDPEVLIALLHDEAAVKHFTDDERRFFDKFVTVPPEDYMVNGKPQYQRAKLCMHKRAPWDFNIYIDGDGAWFDRPMSWLYGEVHQQDFTICSNGHWSREEGNTAPGYTYWCDPAKMTNHYKLKHPVPMTIGDFIAWRRSPLTDHIFETALTVYDDPTSPNIPWGGGKPDEFCFNVACAHAGVLPRKRLVFYFEKRDGRMSSEKIYKQFWGLSTGGSRVPGWVVNIYNRIVNACCIRTGVPPGVRHWHSDKENHIVARGAKKAA